MYLLFAWSNFHSEEPIPPYEIKKDNGASSRRSPKGLKRREIKLKGVMVEEEEASLESLG